MAFAATMRADEASDEARTAAGRTLRDALARGAETNGRETRRVVEGVRAGLARGGRARADAFDAFGAACCAVTRETFGEEVAAEVATRASASDAGDDANHVAKGLEALRFYVLQWDGRSAEATAAVAASIAPAVKFAAKSLDAGETAAPSEASTQAALFLATVCVVCGEVDELREGWRAKARGVLDAAPISVQTLLGPRASRAPRASANEAARRALRRIAQVTAPVEVSAAVAAEPSPRESSPAAALAMNDPVTPLPPSRDASASASSSSTSDDSRKAPAADASFAMRRHFDCTMLAEPLDASVTVDAMFSYQIDGMCAYSEAFCDTLVAASKWVRKCRATLRRSTLLKLNSVSNRAIEHALRTVLDANVLALTSLTRLAKMVGERKLLLANRDEAFIASKNVEAWVHSGFALLRTAARQDLGLSAFAVVALASHEPSSGYRSFGANQGFPCAISARLAFLRWSRVMYAHRAEAKAELLALVHYEQTLMTKAFLTLSEYAPYHRQQANALALKFGLRWRDNAQLSRDREPFEHTFGITTPLSQRASTARSLSQHHGASSIPWAPSVGALGSSRAKTRRTRSVVSRSSYKSIGDEGQILDFDVPHIVFNEEQTMMYDAFQAWIDHTYEQLLTGPSLVATEHRRAVLLRKSFKAMRRYVVRSVGVREKAVAIEVAVNKLDFYVCGGAAFRKWVAGVRYIKRLYAFVDSEVERWRNELRVNCFRAWREVAASGARKTLWEEQTWADITPKLEQNRRRVWLRRWVDATRASLEERFAEARARRRRRLLLAWRTVAGELVVKRMVADTIDKLARLET